MHVGEVESNPSFVELRIILGYPIKKYQGLEVSTVSFVICLIGTCSFSWGKWDRMLKISTTMCSRMEGLSLKMDAFLASQSPQFLISGMDFVFLFVGFVTHIFHASSIIGPFHLQDWFKYFETTDQVYLTKG